MKFKEIIGNFKKKGRHQVVKVKVGSAFKLSPLTVVYSEINRSSSVGEPMSFIILRASPLIYVFVCHIKLLQTSNL